MKGLAFRPFDLDGDEPFVMGTWINSHRETSTKAGRAPRALDQYRLEVMRRINENPPVMLCSEEHSSTLLGWACGNHDVLHYVYVRPELRAMGVGRQLIERVMGRYPKPIQVTHRWPWKSERFVYEPKARAA